MEFFRLIRPFAGESPTKAESLKNYADYAALWKRNQSVSPGCPAPSQFAIRFAKPNCAFDIAARIENTSLARAKPGTVLGVVDCLLFFWKTQARGPDILASKVRFDSILSLGRDSDWLGGITLRQDSNLYPLP
jgi:hypothetical protein